MAEQKVRRLIRNCSSTGGGPWDLDELAAKNNRLITIGRADDNDISIFACPADQTTEMISRHHALIGYDSSRDEFYIMDNNSTHGVFIRPSGREGYDTQKRRVSLIDGDTIFLGRDNRAYALMYCHERDIVDHSKKEFADARTVDPANDSTTKAIFRPWAYSKEEKSRDPKMGKTK